MVSVSGASMRIFKSQVSARSTSRSCSAVGAAMITKSALRFSIASIASVKQYSAGTDRYIAADFSRSMLSSTSAAATAVSDASSGGRVCLNHGTL